MDQSLQNTLVSSNKYNVRFARNEEEIREAQKLRFTVFNLELGEGLDSAYNHQFDVDKYDEQCHHLLVISKDTDEVIGTYRMQTYEMAQKGLGLYTAEEFHLNSFPQAILQKGVEVGRACINKEHRNGRVLFLLWRGLAEFLKLKKAQYLFGCCSLTSQSKKEAWVVMDFLNHNNYLHPTYFVDTKEAYKCAKVKRNNNAWKEVKLPQLFRLYMDLGAKICSPPALDREFKTIDYLVLLDIANLDERTKLLFFK